LFEAHFRPPRVGFAIFPSFGRDQQGHQQTVALQFRLTTLLLQFAAAQDEGAIEAPGEARPVQHPDFPSAGKFLSQPIGDLGLVLTVERGGRLIEDQEFGRLSTAWAIAAFCLCAMDNRDPPVPTL
jgi:hypothetical protein